LSEKQSQRKQIRDHVYTVCKDHAAEHLRIELKMHDTFYGNGLRLKKPSYWSMAQLYTAYPFPLSDPGWIKRSKTIIGLDNAMRLPYYVDTKTIALFDEEASVWLKMYGDADTWLEIFAENSN